MINRSLILDLSPKELEFMIGKLHELCINLDPYGDIGDDMKNKLEQFNIYDFSDPFALTNKMLVLLEELKERLNTLCS